MGRVSDRRRVLRFDDRGRRHRPDTLAVEEPLEIQLNGEPFSVTMRTPGDDVDLAMGFLHSEGVIESHSEVVYAKHCTDSDLNVLEVRLRGPAPKSDRAFSVSSACGVCGTSSMDALREHFSARLNHTSQPGVPMVEVDVVRELPEKLRSAQRVFQRTGGLHAAGLFSVDGALWCAREDIGRHNAVDKVIGWALRQGHVPLSQTVLAVSGRAGAEIVQKAAVAGIPVMAAVSAPSTLAVDLAAGWGMTLAGFIRNGQCNVYSGEERLEGAEASEVGP